MRAEVPYEGAAAVRLAEVGLGEARRAREGGSRAVARVLLALGYASAALGR